MSAYHSYTDMITERGVMSSVDMERARESAAQSGRDLEVVLVEDKYITRESLLEIKGDYYGCSYIDVKVSKIDTHSLRMIPKSMCERYRLICLRLNGDTIEGVMADPHDKFASDYIRMRTGYKIESNVGYWGDMQTLIHLAFSLPGVPEHRVREESLKKETSRFTASTAGPPLKELEKETVTPLYPTWKEQEKNLQNALGTIKDEWQILTLISDVSKELSSFLDKRTLIPKILELSIQVFNVEGVSLILMNRERSVLLFNNVLGVRGSIIENLELPLNESSVAGWVALKEQPVLINDVESDSRHSKTIDEKAQFITRSILAVPVKYGDEVLGVIEAVNKKEGEFKAKEIDYMLILASHAAIALKNSEIYDKLHNFSVEAVELLIDFLEYLDKDFKGHMVEVARISTGIGEELNLGKKEMEDLCYAALLHDIGVVKARDAEMEKHPIYSAEILHHIKLFEGLLPYVLYHHERFDGSGYPYRLEGDRIPLGAQIIGVAEAYMEGLRDFWGENKEDFLTEFLAEFDNHFSPGLKEPFKKSIERSADFLPQY